MKNVAVIFAGGTGKRMGIEDIPKQFLEVDDKPIIIHTIERFDEHPEIDDIYVVCIEPWIDYLKHQIEKYDIAKVKSIISGGTTGQDSIYRGLKEASKYCDDDDIVLIHDGVRPFIDGELISRNISDAKLHGNAITCTNCNETFILSKNGVDVADVPIRRESFNAQAPQTFHLGEILNAHEIVRKDNPDYEDIVDSCTLFQKLGLATFLTKGLRGNIKITDPVDIYLFKAWLEFKRSNGKTIGVPDMSEYEDRI